MTDSYIVYLPRPEGDLRAWLQDRWDRISQLPYFCVYAPGATGPADVYQVMMGIHHDGPDPRPSSHHSDEVWGQASERRWMQAVDESGDHLLPTIQPSDPSDPGENGAPFPESWFETVYKAITFKMTTYRSGSLEMIITLAEPRAAEYYEKFVQQLGDMPGVKVVSEGWSGRESKQTRDQPKIGAPKLSELDDGDPRVEVLKNELRQYLRYRLAKHPKSQDEAAQLVGKGRTTLERYRETWPEIEVEIKKEIEASLAQKVRKV